MSKKIKITIDTKMFMNILESYIYNTKYMDSLIIDNADIMTSSMFECALQRYLLTLKEIDEFFNKYKNFRIAFNKVRKKHPQKEFSPDALSFDETLFEKYIINKNTNIYCPTVYTWEAISRFTLSEDFLEKYDKRIRKSKILTDCLCKNPNLHLPFSNAHLSHLEKVLRKHIDENR
jgi:hypothetical protein